MYYRDICNLRMIEPMSGFPTEIIKISIQKIEAKIPGSLWFITN
jgi:hypothetical protein